MEALPLVAKPRLEPFSLFCSFRIASRPQLFQISRLRCPSSRHRLATAAAMKDWRSLERAFNKDGDGGGLDPKRRLEMAWSVRQQTKPVACERCAAQGANECEWCSGSGYFVLGDKMLCQVPSRNTSCLICQGHGTVRCVDCLGTGFRARWLETMLEKKKK